MDESRLLDERRLRWAARDVRPVLGFVLDGDAAAVARLTADIDRALALPEGTAKRELRRVLLSDARVHAWVLARIGAAETTYRSVPESPPPRYGTEVRGDGGYRPDAAAADPAPDPAPSLHPAPSLDPAPPPDPAVTLESNSAPLRHLHARMPDRVETGRPLSLVVTVTLDRRDGASSTLRAFPVPAEGATVTVLVSTSGLVMTGEPQAEIHVPAAADSDPYRFALVGGEIGLHTVTVEAFRGGTYLGAVTLQVSVERSVGATVERAGVADLQSLTAEPGEVTLQVRRDGDSYRFQLIADTWFDEVTAAMGDVTAEVSQLAAELRAMAAKDSPYRSAQDVRDRVRQLGIGLWSAAVPDRVQEQFWRQAGRIGMFTIVADNDTIPWELLYPLNETDDNGFLAEQFPVVRRVYGAERVKTLPMSSAAYVVPPGSPANALDEVTGVRQRLGDRIADRGVVSELGAAKRLVLDSPGLLHFACHNAFSDTAGSSIKLDGGPWKPSDLAEASKRRTMAATSPLVFLNACRSAGEADWFSQMNGWAKNFVTAGAGAFIGSLWAVRSSSARAFAEAFYDELVTEGRPLGAASLRARKAIAEDDGDPTWLAYSVYGNPAAVAAPRS